MRNVLNAVVPMSHWASINELSSALGPLLERQPNNLRSINVLERGAVPNEWQDTSYRQAAMEGTVENMIAWQVRINREERGMTQENLAALMGTRQSAISRLEDPEGGDVLVSTLVKAAHAFDCALVVRLVDYVEFAVTTRDVRPERLFAAGFAGNLKRARVKGKRLRTIEYGRPKT